MDTNKIKWYSYKKTGRDRDLNLQNTHEYKIKNNIIKNEINISGTLTLRQY